MDLIIQTYHYVLSNSQVFQQAVGTHLELSGLALLIGFCISIPLGIISAKNAKLSNLVMSTVNGLRVIPSLAILVLVMPLLGTGFVPALVALIILSCPPMLINTYLGVKSVEKDVIESAIGMGMNGGWILFKIEIPQAIPLMMSGIRTASVEIISSATLAAFIGGGGLGTFIINGLGMYDFSMLLTGAIPVALLAVFSEVFFGSIERWLTKYKKV